jgi:hypothetical protein
MSINIINKWKINKINSIEQLANQIILMKLKKRHHKIFKKLIKIGLK